MKTAAQKIETLLAPEGFRRHKRVWNKVNDRTIDVIDIQFNRNGDTFTINCGVVDLDVHKIVWDCGKDTIVEQPTCTVVARLGELVDGHERWWQTKDSDAVDDALLKIKNYVLPFLGRMQARDAMREWLVKTEVIRKRYPPPIMYLSILEIFLGKKVGCDIFSRLHDVSSDAWRSRIAEIQKKISCT